MTKENDACRVSGNNSRFDDARFRRAAGDRNAPAGMDGKPHIPIRIFNARQVSVLGNHIQDRRRLISGAIKVTEDCKAVDVRDNTLRQ